MNMRTIIFKLLFFLMIFGGPVVLLILASNEFCDWVMRKNMEEVKQQYNLPRNIRLPSKLDYLPKQEGK